MTGPGPRVQFQSVPALFAGAIDFETPDGAAASAPAKEGSSFTLYDSKDTAENALGPGYVSYRATFVAAEAQNLDIHAPVMLADKQIGSVEHSALQYDPRSGQLALVVTIGIDPARISLAAGGKWQGDAQQQMNALMQHLIAQGLRARLGKNVPLVGSEAIQLQFVPNAKPGGLRAGDVPELPTAPGSDINGMIASVSSFSGKLNAMPLDQIAANVHNITQRLSALSQSQQLKQSLQHLDQAVATIDQVAQDASRQVRPLLTELRGTAREAEATAASARSLIAGNGMVRNQPDTTSMGNALYELSRAARSLRELADYLDRHPEALVKGKG